MPVDPCALDLPGPSRRIVIEPLRTPEPPPREPDRAPAPEPAEHPATPEREPQPA
jgi:hypothetical protein